MPDWTTLPSSGGRRNLQDRWAQRYRGVIDRGATVLRSTALLGGVRFGLPDAGAASLPLVKDHPAFGWDGRHQTRVQLIVINLTAARRQYLPELIKALEAMDLDALCALVK